MIRIKYILILAILLLGVINVGAVTPITSGIYYVAYSDDAYIIWSSDLVSDNRVEYSANSDMSASSWSSWDNSTTDPMILITGLTRDTTYYYNVSSENGGDTNTSATLSFDTKNNTHGFSRYFDEAFVVNDIDGWSVGQSMISTYTQTVGEYIFFTLFFLPVFLVITIRTESIIIPTALALFGAVILTPLLPPEFDLIAKVILSLTIAGTIWHFFIGRR